MHELTSCENCRWWVPDPGTPPPVPRLNQFQPGECRMRSLGRPKRSDQWCARWAKKKNEEKRRKRRKMMFGYISKRKLKAYMDEIKKNNRAECNGANYDLPISDAQKTKNVYAQGYEDGTDNFFNAVCHKFKIERKFTNR